MNEAVILSAAAPLAWQKEIDADISKVNVNDGACAIGHPRALPVAVS